MSGVVIEIIFINDIGGAHQVPVESLPLVRPKSRDNGWKRGSWPGSLAR
jgi:hypothetical protein